MGGAYVLANQIREVLGDDYPNEIVLQEVERRLANIKTDLNFIRISLIATDDPTHRPNQDGETLEEAAAILIASHTRLLNFKIHLLEGGSND
jgi:hypothetical protein